MVRLQENKTRATGTAEGNKLLKSNSVKKNKNGTYEYYDSNVFRYTLSSWGVDLMDQFVAQYRSLI